MQASQLSFDSIEEISSVTQDESPIPEDAMLNFPYSPDVIQALLVPPSMYGKKALNSDNENNHENNHESINKNINLIDSQNEKNDAQMINADNLNDNHETNQESECESQNLYESGFFSENFFSINPYKMGTANNSMYIQHDDMKSFDHSNQDRGEVIRFSTNDNIFTTKHNFSYKEQAHSILAPQKDAFKSSIYLSASQKIHQISNLDDILSSEDESLADLKDNNMNNNMNNSLNNNNNVNNSNKYGSNNSNGKQSFANSLLLDGVMSNSDDKSSEEIFNKKPYTKGVEQILLLLSITNDELEELAKVNTQRFPDSAEITYSPEGKILTASFSQLVILLTIPDYSDLETQSQFLISFPSFTEPRKVLAAILIRFFANIDHKKCNISNIKTLKTIRQRITRIISKWLTLAKYQFTQDMILAIEKFCQIIGTQPSLLMQKRIIEASLNILKGIKLSHKVITSYDDCPEPILPANDQQSWSLLTLNPLEVARQLTILHSAIFRKIKPTEILAEIWKRCKGTDNLTMLKDHFNSFSNYVTFTTLISDSKNDRTRIYQHWVKVANHCHELHNYHGLFAIFSGLTHPSINRLNQTIKRATKKKSIKKAMKRMITIGSFDFDYKAYRNEISTVFGSCVPFVGTIQKDLIYVQESYPNFIDGLINFKKCVACVDLIKNISKFQNERYHLIENDTIQNMLKNLPPTQDNIRLMKLSLDREKKK